MVQPSEQDDKNLQLELAQAKHRAQKDDLNDPPPNDETPAWMNALQDQVNSDPNVDKIMGILPELLKNIPLVAESKDKTIKDNFFKQIIKELARIYLARVNIVEMNRHLSEVQKNQQITAINSERSLRILEVATLLGSYKPDKE